jgi:hypothetical protein
MAKDKGKTKGDDTVAKKAKAKGGDDFAKPSEAPAGGDGWRFEHEDHVGELFLITPLRVDSVTSDKYGESEVIVCDIVHLNEKKPEKSEAHTDVYAFGAWVRGSLRGFVGERKVLGRLGQDASKSKSKSPAWVLEDADDDDIAIAKAYLASVDPFAAKSGGKKSKK